MNEKPDLQNKYIASDQKQPKNSQPGDSSERLAICSMVAGIVGVLCACCCFPSGLICGAIGIVMANSLLGEITPAMATAIGSSKAYKILIPVNRCNHYIVGCQNNTLSDYINMVCEEVGKEVRSRCEQ